jgi:proteasome assembly chaperone (PAC2) family protein
LLLLGDLQGSQVVSHKIVREGLEDRIEILVRCLEFTLGNVDVGAIQMSWQVAGVDFD